MITNTMGCIFVQTPLHIQQEYPIDPVYQHGLSQADDDHMRAVREYVDNELYCPDAVLRQEGPSVYISFTTNRPNCPYHNRVHDHENMLCRISNSKDG